MRARDILARALDGVCPANGDAFRGLASDRHDHRVDLPLRAGTGDLNDRAWANQLADDDTLTYGEPTP